MRKIFAFLMTTADGYHAAPDGDLSWHNVDNEFERFAVEQLDEADSLLFGRKTYLGMAEYWPSPAVSPDDPVADRMNGYRKIVVSRTLASADWGPSTLVRDDVPARLAAIKQEPGLDIALLGSSTLAASLLTDGLLDELRIMVNPVVLGHGQPLLGGADVASLDLVGRVRRFGSGNVLLTYRPWPAKVLRWQQPGSQR
jgi:dihydrofolate reductase